MKRWRLFIVLSLVFLLSFAFPLSADASASVGKVTGVTVDSTPFSAYLSFNKVKNASGYKVYLSKDNKSNFKCVQTLKGSASTYAGITDLEHSSFYYVKVRAYKNVYGKRVYGAYSPTKMFITNFSSPTYGGVYVSYPTSKDFASLSIENSNMSYLLDIDLASAYIYNTETGSVVCGLLACYYADSDSSKLKDLYFNHISIPKGGSYFISFRQCGTKVDLSAGIYGIAYKLRYNGSEYLARTDSSGSEVSLLSWKSTY